MSTYDCKPTLPDSQVLEFCRSGHLMLEGVVPDEINRKTVAWLDEMQASGLGRSEAVKLLDEDWFSTFEMHNAQASGALRSLLGANYGEPDWLTFFRGEGKQPSGQWHIDGGSTFSPRTSLVKWFYHPTEVTVDMGPTEFVRGSHHAFNQVRFMAHYGSIRGCWKASAPAGSIYLTAYPLWHRRAASTRDAIRYMLTTSIHRNTSPIRDWVREPDFDARTVNYQLDSPRFGEQFRSAVDVARMYFWLCGREDDFHKADGPGWPMPCPAGRAWSDAPTDTG